MTNIAGLSVSPEGLVTGPEWSPEHSNYVLREIRKAVSEEGESDVRVIARVAHTVFTEVPVSRGWPLFKDLTPGSSSSKSMYMMMLLAAEEEDIDSLKRCEAEDVLSAVNVARWLLQLPQQTASAVVFVPDPRSKPRARRVPAVIR